MKKLLLILSLFCATAAQALVLKINGVQVDPASLTSERNPNLFWSSGMLAITDTTLYSIECDERLALDVTGRCTVTGFIDCADQLFIDGYGKAVLQVHGKSGDAAINAKRLQLSGIALLAEKANGRAIKVSGDFFVGSDTRLECRGSEPFLIGGEITLHSTVGFANSEYYFDKGKVYTHEIGEPNPTDVMILPKNATFGYVAGRKLTTERYAHLADTLVKDIVKLVSYNPVTCDVKVLFPLDTTTDYALQFLGKFATRVDCNGKYIYGTAAGIYSGGDLTLVNTSADKTEIVGGQFGVVTNSARVILDNLNAQIRTQEKEDGNAEAIKTYANRIKALNCHYKGSMHYAGGHLQYYPTTAFSGDVVRDVTVIKGSPKYYYFNVAGIPVTSANADDILMDGSAVYNGGTLTFTDANLDCLDNPIIDYKNAQGTLKNIVFNGSNNFGVGSADYAINLNNTSEYGMTFTFSGNGSVDVDGPILIDGISNLVVDGIELNVDSESPSAICKNSGGSGNITLKNITTMGLVSTQTAIQGFGSLVTDNTTMPAGITYADAKLQKNGKPCSTFYIGKSANLLGDFNNDDVVDGQDLVILVNVVCNSEGGNEYDLNNNNVVDGQDITILVNLISGSSAE